MIERIWTAEEILGADGGPNMVQYARRLDHMIQCLDVLGDDISEVQMIDQAGNDAAVVAAARVSYANDRRQYDEEKDTGLLRYLMANSHGTPLEHTFIKYRIKMPLFVIQELLRHRSGFSFNQSSMRYLQPNEHWDVEFYIPPEFRAQSKKNRQGSVVSIDLDQEQLSYHYEQSVEGSRLTYEALLASGCARELARGVLPHSLYSSLYVSVNLRSLFHFLHLRLAPNAQLEIQRLAGGMRDLAEPFFPVLFREWRALGLDPSVTEAV